jgi:GNAT superfamily N-acetyltransferase
MIIRKASAGDIPAIVHNRVSFLNSMNNCAEPPEGYEQALDAYIRTGMADDSFAAWLAEDEGAIVSCGYICFYVIAPGYSNPTGRSAYIQNIFTLPEYRCRGLATELVRRLIDEARARGRHRITLHATAQGRPLYEKFGFKMKDNEMALDA